MNILIIEDYPTVGQITKNILDSNGFISEAVSSGKLANAKLEKRIFDLIIIDVNLKDRNSVELLKHIRSSLNEVLILGIASKATWKEKVEFLNAGADDVMDYPYAIQELIARIHSLTRRPKNREDKFLRYKDLTIDTDMKYVTKNSEEIPLRRREYTLLEYLVKNRNRMLSRNELLDKVWDYRRMTSSNTVDVHVKRVRDKLNDKDLIKTIHGFGYAVQDDAD
jgi:DNA-binding response OmpR family regulator